jgi:hypothetical protein
VEEVRILAWEEPPPVSTGRTGERRGKYDDVVDELRDKPGHWAKIIESDNVHRIHQLTTRINTEKILAFRSDKVGEFTAVSRQDPATGIASVYVRYDKKVGL